MKGSNKRQDGLEFGTGWKSPEHFGPTDGNLVLGGRETTKSEAGTERLSKHHFMVRCTSIKLDLMLELGPMWPRALLLGVPNSIAGSLPECRVPGPILALLSQNRHFNKPP